VTEDNTKDISFSFLRIVSYTEYIDKFRERLGIDDLIIIV